MGTRQNKHTKRLLQLIGVCLFIFILFKLDLSLVLSHLLGAKPGLVIIALLLNIPMVLTKVFRWQVILAPQKIIYPIKDASLAYMGGIFIGLITPGRIGEFIKAKHLSKDRNISVARAFTSVLADRIFDLYILLLIGGTIMLTVTITSVNWFMFFGLVFLFVAPTLFVVNKRLFNCLQRLGVKAGSLGQRIFSEEGWIVEARNGLRELTITSLLGAGILTIVTYSIFFLQCYIIGLSLGLEANIIDTTYAVTLGSLVTLLPISISGLGTREVAIIGYLNNIGVLPEIALGFSLLVFTIFYLGGGVMGFIAWLYKPLPIGMVGASDKNRR